MISWLLTYWPILLVALALAQTFLLYLVLAALDVRLSDLAQQVERLKRGRSAASL